MPPKFIAKNNDRAGGVLPVNAAARAGSTKASTARLKLEIRRLPPGLTLTEFEDTLGDDWKLGKGKADWREYRQGKIKAPGKLPEQSRCYLHVPNEELVREFEQKFLSVVFRDKAGTHKHAEIKHLPPTLGFAPNQRTPLQVKQRADNRQGTIDQDAEFITFLEAETQPLVKPAAVDNVGADKERVEVKSTPLIDDLREKKANKAKAAATKAEKKKEDEKKAKDGKDGKVENKAAAATDKDGRNDKQQMVDQAAKEAAKVLNKQPASKQQNATGKQVDGKTGSPARVKKPAQSPKQQNATPAQPAAATTSGSTSPAPNRLPPHQRPQRNADGIKKMLQKDLGIRPKAANANTGTSPRPAASSSPNTSKAPTPRPASSQGVPVLAPKAAAPSRSAPTPPPASSSMKAYLKHANPSQGMTEMLILQSLSQYGDVTNVTIDPRKGTAIAVFKDKEGLKKAIEAKKVSVAGGAIEVLEFRDPGARLGGGAKGRGGIRGGRGGRGGPASAAGGGSATSTPPPPAASTG